jgi:hypothetical protein
MVRYLTEQLLNGQIRNHGTVNPLAGIALKVVQGRSLFTGFEVFGLINNRPEDVVVQLNLIIPHLIPVMPFPGPGQHLAIDPFGLLLSDEINGELIPHLKGIDQLQQLWKCADRLLIEPGDDITCLQAHNGFR